MLRDIDHSDLFRIVETMDENGENIHILKIVFQRVITHQGIVFENKEQLNIVRDIILKNYNDGTSAIARLIREKLGVFDFQWDDFEVVLKKIKEKNIPSLRMYEKHCKYRPIYPLTMEETVKFLNVATLRQLLKNKQLTKIPRKRVEVEALALTSLEKDDCEPVLQALWREKQSRYRDVCFLEKMELLCHTVIIRFYELGHYRHYLGHLASDFKSYTIIPELDKPFDTSAEYEEKLLHDLLPTNVELFPPFFPGCRLLIHYRHYRDR